MRLQEAFFPHDGAVELGMATVSQCWFRASLVQGEGPRCRIHSCYGDTLYRRVRSSHRWQQDEPRGSRLVR